MEEEIERDGGSRWDGGEREGEKEMEREGGSAAGNGRWQRKTKIRSPFLDLPAVRLTHSTLPVSLPLSLSLSLSVCVVCVCVRERESE